MGKRMSIPIALECLRSEDSAVRRAGRGYLDERGDARTIAALARALEDRDEKFRFQVVWVLGGLGARYDLLLAHLKSDPSAAVRYRCLRCIWPDNACAPEAYRAALEDSDEPVLVEVCIKIGLMRMERGVPTR